MKKKACLQADDSFSDFFFVLVFLQFLQNMGTWLGGFLCLSFHRLVIITM